MKKIFYANLKKINTSLFMIIFMFSCLTFKANAQGLDSKGKDFWLMFNTNLAGSGQFIRLYITSSVNTSGTVSGPSFSSVSYTVTANTVTEVTLNLNLQSHSSDVVDNKGIHIVANDEVTVYGLNRRDNTTDAFLGLPTDVLGTDYIVLTYQNVNVVNGVQLGIVATQNSTTVTITPSVTTGSRTAGTPYNITMNAGDAYQLQNGNLMPADLTGTIITSDKPIGVFGASQCANIPSGSVACDHICEMIPPRSTWGKKFGTVPLKTRTGGDTWRFLASENSTVITINGVTQSTINKGQFIEKNLSTQSLIESDKPILVAQYSNSSSFDNKVADPFMMLVPPLEQFLANYTLSTVAGFSSHYVNLIAPNSIVGSITIDNVAINSALFSAIGSSGFSGAQIDVSAGSHTFNASLPFGAFQYGFGDYDSYGYPGGQSFSPVATVSSLVINFQSSTNPIGTNKCINAQVLDQNSANVIGVRVDFSSKGVNGNLSTFDFTNNSGLAQFCLTGNNVGVDTVIASVGNVKDTSYLTWTCTPPSFTSCPSNSSVNTSVATVVNYSSTASGSPSPVITFKLVGATTGSGSGTGTGSTLNPGVTSITIYAENGCGKDSCKFTFNLSQQCGAGTPTGANVTTGNVTINTQSQMNAFYSTVSGPNNGKRWTKINGSLTLNGNSSTDPITNFCNLSSLTEITGMLYISNFNKSGNPTNLSQLSSLTTIGCNFTVISNPQLLDLTLSNLATTGCAVTIKDNGALRTIDLPLLQSIQGDKLLVKNHPKLETLSVSTSASSFNFTGRGSNVEITDNGGTASGNLTMNLKKITTLKGALTFNNNDNAGVSNFDNIFTGLTDLSTKWGKLIITNNDYLGTCCIAASVNVGGSGNRHIISGNTGNCADSATVLANCGVFHKKSSSQSGMTKAFVEYNVYPNPSSGIINLDVKSNQSGQLNLTITDLMGRTISTESHVISQYTSLPISLTSAASGTYFLKAEMNGEVFVKRIVLNK